MRDVSSGWCCSCEPLPCPLALSLWNCACARPWSTPVVAVCVLGDKYSERSVSTRSTHRVLAWEHAAGPVTEHSVSTSEFSVISLSAREVGRRKSGDSRMVVRRRGRAMRECMGVCTCARARVRVCACVCVWMYSNVPQRGAMPSAGAGAQWFYGCNGYYAHYHYRKHGGLPEGTRLSGPPEARRGDRRQRVPMHTIRGRGPSRHPESTRIRTV